MKPIKEKMIRDNLEHIGHLREQGYTEAQICKALDITEPTLWKYKKTMPELREVLSKSREILIENLEKSLFQKAMGGYPITKTIKRYKYDDAGNQILVSQDETTEIATYDLGALCFSLKNLCPDRWRDKFPDNSQLDIQKTLQDSLTVFNKIQKEVDKKDE